VGLCCFALRENHSLGQGEGKREGGGRGAVAFFLFSSSQLREIFVYVRSVWPEGERREKRAAWIACGSSVCVRRKGGRIFRIDVMGGPPHLTLCRYPEGKKRKRDLLCGGADLQLRCVGRKNLKLTSKREGEAACFAGIWRVHARFMARGEEKMRERRKELGETLQPDMLGADVYLTLVCASITEQGKKGSVLDLATTLEIQI